MKKLITLTVLLLSLSVNAQILAELDSMASQRPKKGFIEDGDVTYKVNRYKKDVIVVRVSTLDGCEYGRVLDELTYMTEEILTFEDEECMYIEFSVEDGFFIIGTCEDNTMVIGRYKETK